MICRSVKVQYYFPPLFFRNTRFRDSRKTSVHYSSFSSQNTNTHFANGERLTEKTRNLAPILKHHQTPEADDGKVSGQREPDSPIVVSPCKETMEGCGNVTG